MRNPQCLTVESDGFHGFFFEPAQTGPVCEALANKALIVVGGSEGNDNIPRGLGARFAREGIAALGVCYWNVPGLPDELVEVPIESIERAVAFLQSKGFEKVGIYGISKGGELALLAASLMPALSCVIALSPLDYVMPGITGNKSMASKGISEHSSWTWREQPLPCVRGGMRIPYGALIWRLLATKQLEMRFMYERLLERANEDSFIKVENIAGPVLIISPAHDATWPSDAACKRIEERLRMRAHPWEVQRLSFQHASHIMVPMEGAMNARSLRMFKAERTYPRECAASREAAFTQTVAFLKRW